MEDFNLAIKQLSILGESSSETCLNLDTNDLILGPDIINPSRFSDNYDQDVLNTNNYTSNSLRQLGFQGESIISTLYASIFEDRKNKQINANSFDNNLYPNLFRNERISNEDDDDRMFLESSHIIEQLLDKIEKCEYLMQDENPTDKVLVKNNRKTFKINSNVQIPNLSTSVPRKISHLKQIPILRESLFPNFPPTINFAMPNECIEQISTEMSDNLTWKIGVITPNVVKDCILHTGFKLTEGQNWMGYFGKHMKANNFKTLKSHQKFNHFPGSFQIGRKDNLWRNLYKMQIRYGQEEFDFTPKTFILPNDYDLFRSEWESRNPDARWIKKPRASARGIGIEMVSKLSQVEPHKPAIIQNYITNPMLINNHKFDLRVYVYVTSFDPLRIYIYEDGLVRFATEPYTNSLESLSNQFIHLTNYSINKENEKFQQNSDATQCFGHKWSLKALWPYLISLGINTQKIWDDIKDIAVKVMISAENFVVSQIKANVKHRECLHELFGFDILLDENYTPWLIEVNISPSLHSTSDLDTSIKAPMVANLFNLAGFRFPQHLWHQLPLSNNEKCKQAHFTKQKLVKDTYKSILTILTPDDCRLLIECEDEFSRCGKFERIFPTPNSTHYLKYFTIDKYYNILLQAWLLNVNLGNGFSRLSSLSLDNILFSRQPPSRVIWNASRRKSILRSLKSLRNLSRKKLF